MPRSEKAFAGLALQERIEAKKARARCAIQAIDLRSDDVMHRVRFEGPMRELYDVVGLKDCARPMAIGFQTDEICLVITVGAGCGRWGRRGARADRPPATLRAFSDWGSCGQAAPGRSSCPDLSLPRVRASLRGRRMAAA